MIYPLLAFLAILTVASATFAQPVTGSSSTDSTGAARASASVKPGDDVVLAENAWVKLTVADYRTELLGLPDELRGPFATDPRRVAALLNNLLTMKTLAAQARQEGIDKKPETRQRLALEADRLLATTQVQALEAKYGAEFDAQFRAQAPQFTARARELYLVDRSKYATPPQAELSHILFAKGRGEDVALQAAKAASAQIAAGADFATLARSLSDDVATKASGGHLGWRSERDLDAGFAKAAFALTKDGEISGPVLSSFGYHLIRLEHRRPAQQKSFEEVKDEILAEMRIAYINEHRDAAISAIRTDASIKANQPAIDALVERAPAASTTR